MQDALDESYANSDAYLAGLNAAHPIGSIFMTVDSNYNTAAKVGAALGGTWEAISEGRVLLGAGTNGTYTFTVGGTQSTVAGNSSSASQTITNPLGEYTHKLVVAEMPSHQHKGYYYESYQAPGSQPRYPATDYNTSTWGSGGVVTQAAGSSYYHNNIQPYLVVYMYKRTA